MANVYAMAHRRDKRRPGQGRKRFKRPDFVPLANLLITPGYRAQHQSAFPSKYKVLRDFDLILTCA